MNKYKVKNTVTGEETICEKVVVDGFNYYVNNDEIIGFYYNPIENKIYNEKNKKRLEVINKHKRKKIIATTNPSLDLPRVIDEVEENYYKELEERREVAKNFNGQVAGRHRDFFGNIEMHNMVRGYLEGYNKAKETYSFTKEDMVEFAKWYQEENTEKKAEMYFGFSDLDMLAKWQEQRTKTILVK